MKPKPAKERPKRIGRPPSGKPRKETVITLKGDAAWKEWVDQLARHARLPKATLLDQALITFAEKVEFTKPAPPRI